MKIWQNNIDLNPKALRLVKIDTYYKQDLINQWTSSKLMIIFYFNDLCKKILLCL